MVNRSFRLGLRTLALAVMCSALLLAAGPAAARPPQSSEAINPNQPDRTQQSTDASPRQKAGSVPTSSVGTAGQRREQSQSVANIKPTARLQTRIANRVQSRIRNRIDRFYDPQANAISPFTVAADQAQSNADTATR